MKRLKELQQGYVQVLLDKEPDKIKMIYHPNILELSVVKTESIGRFIVSVLMGAMHVQSSGFLSVSMPNTFSMGWNYVKKYIKEKNLECPFLRLFEVFRKKDKTILKKK